MAWRSFTAPPDDPNGNAGRTIYTDDNGNFSLTPPAEGGVTPSDTQPASTPTAPSAPAASGGGGASDDQIRSWAHSLGRDDLIPWARDFVARNGRLPNSLAEVPHAQNAAPGAAGQGGGTPTAPGSSSDPWVNLGNAALGWQSVLGTGQLDLARQRFNQLELPQFDFSRDFSNRQLGQQNTQFNAQLNQQNQQFGSDLALRQQIADAQTQYQRGLISNQEAQNRINEALGRGNLALGAYGLASNEATARQQLALQAANAADQQAMARGQLLASLRGPADAFKQQEVNFGLNAQGGSRLADILSGRSGAPAFQGAQAAPVAANLDTLANQMAGRPVDAPRYALAAGQTPTDIAMGLAQQNAANPYGSPSAQGALALAAPNAAFNEPGNTAQGQAASATGGLDWNAKAQALVDAYHAGARGPGMWASTFGIPLADAQRLSDASQAWTNAHGGQTAPGAVLSQLASDLGLRVPNGGQAGVPTAPAAGSPAPGWGVLGPGDTSDGAGSRWTQQTNSNMEGWVGPGSGQDPNRMYATTSMRPMQLPSGPAQGASSGGDPMAGGGQQVAMRAPAAPNDNPMGRGGTDPMMGGPQGPTAPGGPTSRYTPEAQSFLNSVPDPNKIVARNFFRAPQSAQQFTLGALEAKGYDQGDALNTIRQTLPQRSAAGVGNPYGSIAA